jgi:diguanylate cyclase (GGDEF)-like protein
VTEEATRARAPGEPAPPPAGASLVFVEGEALLGLRVPLPGEAEREVVLGRDGGCNVVLPSDDVSRRHARIAAAAGARHVLADLGSTNGTFVNGARLAPLAAVTLAPGDRIALGPFTARYLAAGDPAARELEALAGLARRDALTGLPNRRAFDEALAREVARAARAGAPLAVVALDVDHFKRVNDGHGHAAGDAALRAVAARALAALRTGDLLARVGGEEFAALLPGAALADAREVAERVRLAVAAAPIDAAGAPGAALALTVSLGCATLGPGEAGAALVARADARLYDAKHRGRNRVEG